MLIHLIRNTSPGYVAANTEYSISTDWYTQTYFTDKAATWYKNGKADGKVICVWPGGLLVLSVSSRR